MNNVSLRTLYKTLGVRAGASAAEIRRAFRRRAKALHPDVTGRNDRRAIEAFHNLVYAYNTLMDSKGRGIFYPSSVYGDEADERDTFDYHTWLLAREDDESRAKLIFWDLMHAREDESVDEYCRITRERSAFSLRHWFTREDFMDMGYILAEELHIRKRYSEALSLLNEIIAMEGEKAYFRLFFPEVVSFAKRILKSMGET